MKKIVSILVLLCMILGIPSAFASGDEYWIYTYKGFADWMHASSTIAGLCIDPENFGEFAWPSETTTLTAIVDKNLTFSPHPSLGRGNWSVPSHVTVNGVELVYGSTQGSLETAQLTIAGAWNGDVKAHKNFTLTGSVQGDVSVSGDSTFDLSGEIDGNLTMSNAAARVDLSKVKNLHIYEPCEISGNLKAEGLSFGGYLGVEHTLTIQSGSVVEITGGDSGSQGEELIVVESGATLTLYDDTYANITVKNGGVLNLNVRGGGCFDLINAHLNIEKGGLVNAYGGIMVHYSEYYGDKNGKIMGSGTICFWNPAEEYLPKYYYVYQDSEGETEYTTNDGNVPRVDATVIFTSAVCEHERGDNPWISYEEYHTYICSKCNREIDGGLHSFNGADVVVTAGGSIYTCKQCGYVKNSGVFWGIKNGVLSIQGNGDIPYFNGGTKKTPWYDKRESIKEIVIGEGVTGINSAFADCTSLTSVRIPSSMTYLSGQMFKGCSGIKRVEMPAGLENVSTGAFDGCTALTEVYFGGTQEQWEDVRIGSKNDALKNATVHFNTPMLGVTAQKGENQTTVTITPSNLEVGTVVLLGCYQKGVLTDIQKMQYQGEALTFPVTEAYDTIKVMAWADVDHMRSACTSVIQ